MPWRGSDDPVGYGGSNLGLLPEWKSLTLPVVPPTSTPSCLPPSSRCLEGSGCGSLLSYLLWTCAISCSVFGKFLEAAAAGNFVTQDMNRVVLGADLCPSDFSGEGVSCLSDPSEGLVPGESHVLVISLGGVCV